MDNTRYKVLLVEDDKIDQIAFKRLVREENLPYDYTIAGSVSEASRILGTDGFDIVIVDYLLGDGTGFDVFDLIKDTPTIFTTATDGGDGELAVKARKAGACDCLIKDLARDYLKALPKIIKNAVSRKKAEQKLEKMPR